MNNLTKNMVGGDHYLKFKIQPIEFFIANQEQLSWCAKNAIKYICRYKFKNGREDLLKAIDYLKKEIESVYGATEPK